jgi:hypothetical protein
MDHISMPEDIAPFKLIVWYIADQAPDYDGKDWQTFPLRCGYKYAKDELNSAGQLRAKELQAFFQRWLYFGLLYEVFKDNPDCEFREHDFVEQPHGTSDLPVITTIKLPYYIRMTCIQSIFTFDGSHSRLRTNDEARQNAQRRMDILRFASTQVNEWELSMEFVTKCWRNLFLSFRVLIETLFDVFGRILLLPPRRLDRGLVMPSLDAIGRHMVKNGWCQHQLNTVFPQLTLPTLIYLANLRRHLRPGIDHRLCEAESRCIAYNIDDSSFQSKHLRDSCPCEHIEASAEELYKILNDGGIPVLSCQRRPDDKVALRYIRASPALQYTAVSHLWADGLGNPRSNSLPGCQLKRIVDMVESGTPTVSRYGYVGDGAFGVSPSMISTVKTTLNRLSRMSRPWKRTGVVNIWLDVYCIPVLPLATDRGATSSVDDYSRLSRGEEYNEASRLKKLAISRMDATYAWAKSVLVLDHELLQVSSNCNETELLARIATSAWNTRCWTYQEHILARIAVYQCEFGPSFRHVPQGREIEHIKFWALTQKPQDPTQLDFGIHRNLEVLALPAHINTGGTVRNPGVVEPWRRGAPDAQKFTNAWNAFFGRNTTKPEDLIGIFANILDLSASEVLELNQDVRMKAIIRAQPSLPLSLLFIDVERQSQTKKSTHTKIDLSERWLPVSPQCTTPLWDCVPIEIEEKSGLLLQASLQHVQLIQSSVGLGSEWLVHAGAHQYRISLDRGELDLCLSDDSSEVLFALDRCKYSRGACLLLQDSDHLSRATAVYVCPIRWSQYDSISRSLSEESEEADSIQATLLDIDVVISCGQFRPSFSSPHADQIQMFLNGQSWQ